MVIAVFVLFTWFLFDVYLNDVQGKSFEASAIDKPSKNKATEADEGRQTLRQKIAHAGTEDKTSLTSATPLHTRALTQNVAAATPSPPLPDCVVVMAKVSTKDTRWVHTDLPGWQSAIYNIDTETLHNASTLDPLTNSTLRTLRNKGKEANAYLAYLVQGYDKLASTIAFVHSHKDGYPTA